MSLTQAEINFILSEFEWNTKYVDDTHRVQVRKRGYNDDDRIFSIQTKLSTMKMQMLK